MESFFWVPPHLEVFKLALRLMRQRLLLPWGSQTFWEINKHKPSPGHLQSLGYFILILNAANYIITIVRGFPSRTSLSLYLCCLLLQNVLGLELMEQPHVWTVSLPWIKTSENCFLAIKCPLDKRKGPKECIYHPSSRPIQLRYPLCHHWGHVISPLQRQLCNYEMC